MSEFYSRSNLPPRCSAPIEGDSLTKQSFKKESDVNFIIAQYVKNGVVPNGNPRSASFLDATSVADYQTALNIVLTAQDAFDSLPANIRKKFGNDPANYVDFIDNPANADEARSLGLLDPLPSPPQPVEVRVVSDSLTPSAE